LQLFACPYLKTDVELTEEREKHILARHPEIATHHPEKIALTLSDPDSIRSSARHAGAKLFTRWFTDVGKGNHMVVVVVGDQGAAQRHWIITAYIARKLAQGGIEWKIN
jgi:hypothetical protein